MVRVRNQRLNVENQEFYLRLKKRWTTNYCQRQPTFSHVNLMSLFRIVLVLICSASFAQAGLIERRVDFSSYDVPLYAQVVNRIKAKILARLGPGINTRERYFIIPFAYQNRGNDPEFSHSFISVIRVFPDNKNVRLTPGLKTRTEANR